MEEQGNGDGSRSGGRWTCEACGCNTNQASDRSCTICGTSNSGPSGLRRAGVAGFAARAGWFARSLGARRGIMNEEFGLDDEDLWESVVSGVAGQDADSAIESLAMEVSGVSGAIPGRNNRLLESRQRFMEAARALSQANREVQAVDPTQLLRFAIENARHYQPVWAKPSQLSGRTRASGNGIEVGEGERINLAHLPSGAAEGRAIRAEPALPRSDVHSPFRMPSPNNLNFGQPAPQRRAYGFRVAFDHPTCEQGGNMGGCYLIGVTTSSFSAYGEQNGLQQSPFFWGVEDGGQKYEGSRYNQSRGTRRPASASSYSVELGAQEAPMNANGVLFGCREVVTVIVDMESRSLTFWRDETLLGTLIHNIPRTGNVYPVAVPFNCGVTVAITGLDNDPLPLLRTFATDWKQIQQEKDRKIRERLTVERAILIKNGHLSQEVVRVLEDIFLLYDDGETSAGTCSPSLSYTSAARLWYRCGLTLASLDSLLEEKEVDNELLSFQDFLQVVEKILEDHVPGIIAQSTTATPSSCEIGDKVELVEGYEKYGDAAGGPLQPGDRGNVVELQKAPNGELRSIRVLHNGRRWWYQPQAVLSERSGLIETAGFWFLKSILRAHGYDHTRLESLVGKHVTPSSWRYGDIVAPRSEGSRETSEFPSTNQCMVGRIITESPGSTSSVAPCSRESGNVFVEFMGRAFAEAVGIKSGLGTSNSQTIDTRRVRTSKLMYSNVFHESLIVGSSSSKQKTEDSKPAATDAERFEDKGASVSEKLRSEIAGLSRLERSSIDTITKECKKSSDALASLFSAGLPEAILSAVSVAERQMNSLEPRDDTAEKLLALGGLANCIADQLFTEKKLSSGESKAENMPSECNEAEDVASQNREHSGLDAEGDRPPPARDVESRRESERSENSPSQNNSSSMQQRRNMLLTLMSRASRRSNAAAYLNEMNEDVRDSQAHDFGNGGLPPALASMREMPPFVFGAQNEILESVWANARASGNEISTTQTTSSGGTVAKASETSNKKASYLDSLLRCRADATSSKFGNNLKQGGAAYALFARNLIVNGVLIDSVDWTKAIIESHNKKGQVAPSQRSSGILKNIVDEEGTPLLQLAISFGCSTDILNLLISYGTPVGVGEIKKAAHTNQPQVLSFLLRHSPYIEDTINIEDCSPEVAFVIAETKTRQMELDRRMRETAGNFMVQLLRRMLKLCLSARRNQTARLDQCSKTLCELLVGNVLLQALHSAQKASPTTSLNEQNSDRDNSDSGRFSVEESHQELHTNPTGLLGSLPKSILGECLLSERSHLNHYLLVVEDFLYSKDMADTASGLTFLSILLRQFPRLRSCAEIERFGMLDLISYHNVLASNRIAEILSKQLTIGLNMSSNAVSSGEDRDIVAALSSASHTGNGVVVCPKKHTAVLHITRHSSFRCDLCGNGVDRGRPMHGCRECDWDACEDCTDKSESGIVKGTALKNLASGCLRLLEEDFSSDDTDDCDYSHVLDEISMDNSSSQLNSLAFRFLQRDVGAAKELGTLLNEPGKVTVHQFMTLVLPPLHASLLGRPIEKEDSALNLVGGHRSKKARVICGHSESSGDASGFRLDYCREALRLIVTEAENSFKLSELKSGLVAFANKKEDEEGSHMGRNSDEEKEDSEIDKSRQLSYSASNSEILRRLHQVLSLYENVQLISTAEKKAPSATKAGELQALTKLFEVQLSPSTFNELEGVLPKTRSVVHVEPLIPLVDLKLHVLRTYRPRDTFYTKFCERLATEKAIIVERPRKSLEDSRWRLAQVVGFDRNTGAHAVSYASAWRRGQERADLFLEETDCSTLSTTFKFSKDEVNLVLAAREFYILERNDNVESIEECRSPESVDVHMGDVVNHDSDRSLLQAIGTRVESNCGGDGSWKIYTLVGAACISRASAQNDYRFVVVSDEGELISKVSFDQIRMIGNSSAEESSRPRRRTSRADRTGIFPFFAARQRGEFSRNDVDDGEATANNAKALRRSWSALSLIEAMRPVDLAIPDYRQDNAQQASETEMIWECHLSEGKFRLFSDLTDIEFPPKLSVRFSAHEILPGMDISDSRDKTLIAALKEIQQKQEKWNEWPPKSTCKLFFSVRSEAAERMAALKTTPQATSLGSLLPTTDPLFLESKTSSTKWSLRLENRSRKLSSRSLCSEDESTGATLCDGIDELCMQCMELIDLMAQCADNPSIPKDKDDPCMAGFSNKSLSKKLADQLDDPLCVVGGALPDWCIVAPSFSPRLFSYDTRKDLLERVAFGVSRSTLKQQEAKVNVGRLRQRMASLRARAVELVGEAFSGGAEDPTALQLQADELYGMEEALATRVRAAFRAAKWEEHSLQVAKAAVRRDNLLADACAVMDRYANDTSVSRRRLEVRFEGESGFDAASGDEAGVTRGFYADVAEALLSTETVAGVHYCKKCYIPPSASLENSKPMDVEDVETEDSKLPLWIPDLDDSAQVVIPTPRADKMSGLGIFPRPLPSSHAFHPQYHHVLKQFRLIGRLFAAAMRDGFMFPVPLSSAFLKLVQHGTGSVKTKQNHANVLGSFSGMILSSGDLPRPGFLGGEVYAADFYICRALDELDALDPPLQRSELQRRYEEIATDKNFGRLALGKNYDLSFNEYFEDRTFVDPLDPTQGQGAFPLCPEGHTKSVTIFNVREWVMLAKNFMLHDGVIAQASAFREGIEDFFSADFLRLFTSEELQRDVCGVGGDVDNWDESAIRKLFKLDGGKGAAEALVAVAAIGGEGGAALSRRFGPSSPTIAYLVKALLEATPVQRRQFLSFVTSVPIVTPGRIEVVPMVSPSGEFLPLRDPCCLPRANTCSRRLYLPKFESFESFSQVLWAVVREESKFKGFYEWRGS